MTKHAQLGDRNSVRATAKGTPPKRGKVGRWSTHYLEKKQVAIVYGRGANSTFVWLHENTWAGQKDVVRFIVRALNAARVVLPARRERG